jgi:hypothetical protein
MNKIWAQVLLPVVQLQQQIYIFHLTKTEYYTSM